MVEVWTTTDSVEAAEKISAAIVSGQLVAEKSLIRRVDIRAFYWWDGAVQNDTEIRLEFETEQSFSEALTAVGKDHNYDVPMVVAEVSDDVSGCWKGVIASATAELAAELAGTRLVACAQLADSCSPGSQGSLVVKTVTAAKAHIEARVGGASNVSWRPITGNQAYLDWVKEEAKVA